MVRAVAIDSLHCIYLVVTVLLFKVWFHKDYKGADYHNGDKVGVQIIVSAYLLYELYNFHCRLIYVTNGCLE